MQIGTWIKDRSTPGKLADIARRILENDSKYRDVEKTLQSMYVLEALIRHGGNQQQAAKAIGVCPHTVQRTLRSLRLSAKDIRRVATHLRISQ